MALDPAVERLVREAIAANNESRIASGNQRRVDQVEALRRALRALRAALLLDPTRSDLTWKNHPPEDLAATTDRQIVFYVFVLHLADTGQLYAAS